MNNTFIYLLPQLTKKTSLEIGSLAKIYAKLHNANIPVVKVAVIPITTLQLITKINNLDTQIRSILKPINLNDPVVKNKTIKKIYNLITKQAIPQAIADEFLQIYHQYFSSSFIRLTPTNPQYINQDTQEDNLVGDTNIIDALLHNWAKVTTQTLKTTGLKKYHPDTLFLTPFALVHQLPAENSGLAFSFDQRDGNKKRATIQASLGIKHQSTTNYYVDKQTLITVAKDTQRQTQVSYRINHEVKEKVVTKKQQEQDVLTATQITNLTKWIEKIKKLYIPQLKIEWQLRNNRFYILNLQTASYHTRSQTHHTIKKIYITPTNLKNSIDPQQDGVCICHAGQLLTSSGIHPMKLSKQKQRTHLVSAVANSILKYTHNFHQPLIYRSSNFTSHQLQTLKHASSYEVKECNPFLGVRGASRMIGQQPVFNMELDIIKTILKQRQWPTALLLNFVRSDNELQQLIRLVNKAGLSKHNHFNLWLELSTPENILNINNYHLRQIQGVIVNMKNVHALMLGIDPNNSAVSLKKYHDHTAIINLVKLLINSLSNKRIKIMVNFNNYDLGILPEIISTNINGVVANQRITSTIKKCIINQEEKLILN